MPYNVSFGCFRAYFSRIRPSLAPHTRRSELARTATSSSASLSLSSQMRHGSVKYTNRQVLVYRTGAIFEGYEIGVRSRVLSLNQSGSVPRDFTILHRVVMLGPINICHRPKTMTLSRMEGPPRQIGLLPELLRH
jgi:purine nucleoside phosphorylase